MTALWASEPPDDTPQKRPPLGPDAEAYIRNYIDRSRIRDRLEPDVRYRQTTEDEAWLNQIGITGTTPKTE